MYLIPAPFLGYKLRRSKEKSVNLEDFKFFCSPLFRPCNPSNHSVLSAAVLASAADGRLGKGVAAKFRHPVACSSSADVLLIIFCCSSLLVHN